MSGTPLDFIKFASDLTLTVPSQINLRPYVITLITTTWSVRPGVGSFTQNMIPLLNGAPDIFDGYVNPRYRQVTQQEVILSGGLLKDLDVAIGPLVFPYDTGLGNVGGMDPLIFVTFPALTEAYFNIQGPNFPPGGDNFTLVKSDTSHNVMYRLYLRNKAVK